MKIKTTIEAVRAAYRQVIDALPNNKPRDPVERELLNRLGDPNVAREDQGLTRVAGERFTASNSGLKQDELCALSLGSADNTQKDAGNDPPVFDA